MHLITSEVQAPRCADAISADLELDLGIFAFVDVDASFSCSARRGPWERPGTGRGLALEDAVIRGCEALGRAVGAGQLNLDTRNGFPCLSSAIP